MDAVYLWLSDWTELLIVVALVYFRNKKKLVATRYQIQNILHGMGTCSPVRYEGSGHCHQHARTLAFETGY